MVANNGATEKRRYIFITRKLMNELYRTLQPMSIGDILKRAVAFYKNNFPRFIGVILPGKIIVIAIALVVSKMLPFGGSTMGLPVESNISQHASNYPVIILTYFIEIIVIAAGAILISESFLAKEMSVVEAYQKVLARIFPLIGAAVASTLAISVGLFLCVVPGLIAMVWYGLISQVVMIEGEGGLGALKRSKYLASGYFLKAFGIIVSVWIAEMLFLTIVSILATSAVKMSILQIAGCLSTLAFMLIEPFKIVTITLLYYDLRIRKEGFDLEIMAQELEQYKADF